MKANRDRVIRLCSFLLSCIVLIVLSVHTLNRKEAFFLDEFSSYSCANSSEGKPIPFETGVTYGTDEFLQMAADHYSVRESERFHFNIVWDNLSHNVHPPIFYTALHLVSSLTPGVFSVWQAGIINILFAVIALFFFHQLARAISGSEWIGGALCLLWSFNLGLIASVVLLRDYTAAMCGCTMVCWEVYRFWKGHHQLPDLLRLGGSFAFSVLSHYYCAIYLFFLCGLLVVLLMLRKAWREIARLFVTTGGSAVAAMIFFPPLLDRLFSSRRGNEATENLVSLDASDFLDSIRTFYNSFNRNLFGGRISYVVLIGIVLLIVSFLVRKKGFAGKESFALKVSFADSCLLILPAVCYFFMIAKIAPFISGRYLFPVYSIVYLSVFSALSFAVRNLPRQKIMALGVLILMGLASSLSWSTGSFAYLYAGSERQVRQKLGPCIGADAIQITDDHPNLVCLTLQEYKYLNSVTFYDHTLTSKEELLADPRLQEGKDVLLILHATDGSVDDLAVIREAYPEYQVEDLHYVIRQHRFKHYFLHRP